MPTHVVVDGSNIATEGRSTPSLAQLDEAVRAFVAEHPSDRLTVVVDASFGHRIDASERAAFEEAVDANEVITPPAGTTGRGDAFILEIAERAGATVLSNDSFQEFHGDHPWLFEDGRLVGGKPVPDVGWVFLPRTPVRGPASRRATRDAQRASRTADKAGDPATDDAPATSSSGSGSGGGRRRRGRGRGKGDQTGASTQAKGGDQASSSGRAGSRGTKDKLPTKAEPLNEPLPFIEFVGANPVGSTVTGTVERFTSHGAHVLVDGVRCYVDLAGLGDPPPNRARDVLEKDREHDFLILAVDTPRRGIDLGIAGSVAAKEAGIEAAKGRGRAKKAAKTTKATKATKPAKPAVASKGAKSPRSKPAKEQAKKQAAKKRPPATTARKQAPRRTSKSATSRTRGAASAPLPPEPGDPTYGTVVEQPPTKKKGLLGRLKNR